jgi:hypothetical protein
LCWLLPQPSGNQPEACASADCSGLAAFTSCGCQLPQGLWTTGLSIRKNLRSSESALSPAPACVRLAPRAALKPASQSCLGVPVIVEAQLALHFNLPGLPFRMGPLRASILPVSFQTVLENFGLRLRLSHGPSGLAFRFRTSCAWLAPCTLGPSVQLAFASAFRLSPLRFPLRLRRGLDRLIELSACAYCSCLPGSFRIQPTIYCVVID